MNARVSLAVLLLSLGACHRVAEGEVVVVEPRLARPVSIEVEVYDPVTGFVWQGFGVRIVEAYNEWSDCLCETPYPDDWYYTDDDGIAYLSEYEVANADVGFQLDLLGRAMIAPAGNANEATVTLEVWSPTFAPVFVDVDLSWNEPDVFVSIAVE